MPRGRRPRAEGTGDRPPAPGAGKSYMISAAPKTSATPPQPLPLNERGAPLKPPPTEGTPRLYSEDDLRQLEVILNLTRDLGVNLAGVEIVLNMRRKMEQMQGEVAAFVSWVRQELVRANQEGWQERLQQAPGRLPPTPVPPPPAEPAPVAVAAGRDKGTSDAT